MIAEDSNIGKMKVTYAAAALSTLVFAALALAVLFQGHPHEDAYILFIFSETFAETGRIAYYPGGPPAEGATDFLWMIAISGLHWLGIPSGVAAALLNAAGAGLAGWVIADGIIRFGGRSAVALAAVAALPFMIALQAGYGGFSTPLYSALCLFLFRLLLLAGPQSLVLVPLVSIALGLFRPDGVLIGVTATLVGLAVGGWENLRRYLAAMMAAGLVGIVYFLWRSWYFGELLPLPLMVKGASDRLFPGLRQMRDWFEHVFPLVLLALPSLFLLPNKRRLMLAIVPFLAHLVGLSLALHSQNVAYRFEGPQTLVTYYLAVIAFAVILAHRRWVIAATMSVVAAFYAKNDFSSAWNQLRYLTSEEYINFFPQLLAADIPDQARIALTEAGRFAYWTPGATFDLVGLNTAYTARHGADTDYLSSLDPDLVFLHVARVFSPDCHGRPFCEITIADLASFRTDWAVERTAREVTDRVWRAPLAVYEYLEAHPGAYRLFVVFNGARTNNGYNHLYAIARDGAIDIDAFTRALSMSFGPDYRWSYVASLRNL